MKAFTFTTLLSCLLGVFPITSCKRNDSRATASPVLRFSAIPDQNNTELQEKFGALAKYLSSKLGVAVEYRPASDYKASVEMFKNGEITLAWFGALTSIQAKHAVPGSKSIAQGDTDPKFISYFIAHKDTGLQLASEFPQTIGNLTFTFGSESSTSGRLMPEYYIRKNTGKSPAEFFRTAPAFSGSHDQTIELVESGRIQTGAVNFEVYEERVREHKTDPAVCRVIWKTPPFADYSFTAHPKLETLFGAGFTDRLQSALIAIEDEKLLAVFPRHRLIPVTPGEYDAVEEVAQQLGFVR